MDETSGIGTMLKYMAFPTKESEDSPLIRIFRKPLLAAVLLFTTLSCWSFSAPLNNGFDPTFHLASIWCGWGESPGKCENYGARDYGYGGNIPDQLRGLTTSEMSNQQIVDPHTRSLFYPIMRVFAGDNATQSVLLMRLIQSFIASMIFGSLIHFSSRKMKTAVLSAWAFTMIPIIISTLPQTTPRSWAYLSGMSSWAYLMLALDRHKQKQNSKILWILYGFSLFLAVASRWDATLFVAFTTAVVLSIHFIKNNLMKFRTLVWFLVSGMVSMGLLRIIFPRLATYTSFDFGSTFTSGKTIFQLIHIPENIADGLGLGVRLADLGPNLIGIIGVVLFVFMLSRSLDSANKFQIFSVVSIAIFMFMAMFQITLSWTEQIGPSGVYVVQLLTVILGLSVALANDAQMYLYRKSNQAIFISLLGISHALALFARMEWAVRPSSELNDTYFNLSLNGGWWWNSPIGPNAVFLIGVIAFPAWLIVSWNSVSKELAEVSS
jgi:hypothetical protein